MSMVSAKEFADWLYKRFEQVEHGVSMSREDINQLTGRQNFSMVFVHDIHYELMQHGMAFVTDTSREQFFLVRVCPMHWRQQLEQQFDKEIFNNVISINMSR
ncbi:hypothetical protein [Shewanella algae]|uniref:hypothetical protein n=1 Tax=Shewanella algae TaxID=38313 RepID=UPI0008DCFF9A|nr:hypothetical protein [Shewanella algae]MBO2615734.1 hypothetical protein [Shewanella algae]MDC8852263.1 hypothetical protein [Shewanella algae]OHY52038.1 hypothetical protein BEH76_03235 [Shewanella algae]PSS69974.1 hypothetical protein AYI88_17830 [Shewanella algae]QTE85162.1 hypothetical protein JKK44_13775 [Shewanella algae]